MGSVQEGKNIITRRTSRKKLRKSMANFTAWCKEIRHNRLWKIFQAVEQQTTRLLQLLRSNRELQKP